jgi:hypothetical protein
MAQGITNKQARYLATLCREAHVPYRGQGMTMREASERIYELRVQLGKQSGRTKTVEGPVGDGFEEAFDQAIAAANGGPASVVHEPGKRWRPRA